MNLLLFIGEHIMKKLVKSLSYLLATSLIVLILPTNTQAAPNYIYEWISQNGAISADGLAHEFTNLQAGQTIQLSLILRNESDYTVRAKHLRGNPEPGHQVPAGSYGIGSQTPYQDGTPNFLDLSSFVLNNNRFVYYEGEDVSHGRDVHIAWTIKLKDNLVNGVYKLYVRPVFEYIAWTKQIKNGQLLPSTNSDIFWRFVVGDGAGNADWRLVTNSGVGFSVSLPNDYGIHGLGMFDDPQSSQVSIYRNNMASLDDHGYINIENETALAEGSSLNDPYRKVLDMTLQEWALNLYQENKDSPVSVVGPLTPGWYLADNKMGYYFRLEGYFNGTAGFSYLGENKTYKVYLVDNKHGDKIYIYHKIDDILAEQILATLKFI